MVTVTCKDNECPNGGINYNVWGTPAFVECGGCGAHLDPTHERDDPPPPPPPQPPS